MEAAAIPTSAPETRSVRAIPSCFASFLQSSVQSLREHKCACSPSTDLAGTGTYQVFLTGSRSFYLLLDRIAVVTGGNKGIGLEVCRQLAGAGATVVVLTARDETRGAAAAQELRESGLSDVIFHQLDITDAASVSRLAEFLKARFGKLDILVNNAAVGAVEYVQDPADSSTSEEELSGMDMVQRLQCMLKRVRETYDAATEGIKTNYYGIKHVIEALLPLLQASSDGRIVNVSSDFGLLRLINNEEAKAGAKRRGEAHRGEAGRGAGRVPERLRRRRGGGARVAGGLLGLQGGQGGHERVHEDPSEEPPGAARQLRAPRLREHRHDRPHRASHARARRGQRREGGAAAGGRPDRRVLRVGRGGVLYVTKAPSSLSSSLFANSLLVDF
ncbi:uncharacterized isoform X4 [Zea mays]|uniref:uncharacterized isoform X4 n=1 Tax=Zea mays TaxID=4577 RepID=UPI0009A99594|nr:uncharacterized protein LOC100192556 isoform X4 [Zea mays]|eukprot:XP_020400446.1 uncharacterized LOC100192556 isoform X4 [Zea mays]